MQNAGERWAKQGVEAFSVKLVPKPSFCESWGSAPSPPQRARGPHPPINGGKQGPVPAGKEREESMGEKLWVEN